VPKRSTKPAGSLIEAAALSALDLFKDLPASSLRELEKNSAVREFSAGHVFFRPGESGQVLFLLEKGRVQTFRATGNKKLIIAELQPPAVFGEMGCIGQGMYHCCAQALKLSRIRTISRGELEIVLRDSPDLTRRFLDLVSQRFLHVLRDLESTSFRNLLPRLAALLLVRAEGDAVHGLTHRELAQYLGVYRESATAALGELRTAGIVSLGRKQIRILDRSRLERAARE
jgi:CRP-like cAMP-binding protein